METVPVKEMKKWAKDNLPPMAWQRVTFRLLPQLNQMNVFLHSFEDDTYLLQNDVFKVLDTTFLEMFGKQFTPSLAEIVAPVAKEALAFVPIVVPVDEPEVTPTPVQEPNVVQEVKETKSDENNAPPAEHVEKIELPKEEKEILQTPANKPFVPFFSPEQLKRIFGKKD